MKATPAPLILTQIVAALLLLFPLTAHAQQLGVIDNGVTVNVQYGNTAEADELYVGIYGSGSLNILGGSTLNSNFAFIGAGYVGGGSTGQVFVGNGYSQWNNSNSIGVAVGGSGSLIIQDGGTVSTSQVSIYANGNVTVADADSYWNSDLIYVSGYDGNGHFSVSNVGGSFNVLNGAVVNSPAQIEAGGVIHVSGTGSQWSNGSGNDTFYSNGTLRVEYGGKAITYLTDTNGRVDVSGAGSKWINTAGKIGSSTAGGAVHSGTLNVTNGGSVEGTWLWLGETSGSKGTVVVSGGGSVMTQSSDVVVGWSGVGEVNIKDGGKISTGLLRIGYLSGSQGTVKVGASGGATAQLLAGSVIVGDNGNGQLLIQENGFVSASSSQIGSNSTGSVLVTGSAGHRGVLATSRLTIGNSGSLTLDGGVLRALGNNQSNFLPGTGSGTVSVGTNGGFIDTNGYSVRIDKAIAGQGSLTKQGAGTLTINGSNTNSGSTVIENGTLQIGNGGTTGSVAGNIENNSQLTFNRSDNLTYSSIISGSGDVTKLGAGNLTFASINTYTGATFVNAGTLTVDGSISGAGGLVTIFSGATLNGSGTVNRDVLVNAGGTLSSSLKVTGQVTLPGASQQNVGNVGDGGSATASSGQQIVVGTATGGSVDVTAGTAVISTLDGAVLQTGNWGATVNNLNSGDVQTSGGSVVAQQGNFIGTISGTGGLTKTGAGTLTINSSNDYTGTTIVGGGTLAVAAGASVGNNSAPVEIVNNGRFQALAGAQISNAVVAGSTDAVYEKVYSTNEDLSNLGTFKSDIGSNDTTALIAEGTAESGTSLTAQYASALASDPLVSERLHLDGLDYQTFLLVMDVDFDIPVDALTSDFYLGWLDGSTWKNAVAGNHGTDGSLAGAYAESYQDFLHGTWDPEAMLGAYGVDTATDQVWAVVDHNSDFGAVQGITAVPEPAAFAGIPIAVAAILLLCRRRKVA